MEAWLIYDRDAAEYNQKYIQFYIDEGAKLKIKVRLILTEELEFGVLDNKWFINYQNKKIEQPDFAICRVIYPLLSKQLEFMGIRVFNNSFVAEICNDKAKTYQYLAKTGIKMVDSIFVRNSKLKEHLTNVKENSTDRKVPSIIKAVNGHGGSQVFLIEEENKTQIVKGLGSSDAVIQPLTGSRHQDLRVYVIGKKIIAAVLRTAKDGFKANYSLGGEVTLYNLSDDEIEIINIIIGQFEFGLVGIDFIIGDKGELIFNEIEDVVGARMLYLCSKVNLVELYLRYIIQSI